MQTNNLLRFIIITITVVETVCNIFERVDKLMLERNARQSNQNLERNAQQIKPERNAQRAILSNQRKRSRN